MGSEAPGLSELIELLADANKRIKEQDMLLSLLQGRGYSVGMIVNGPHEAEEKRYDDKNKAYQAKIYQLSIGMGGPPAILTMERTDVLSDGTKVGDLKPGDWVLCQSGVIHAMCPKTFIPPDGMLKEVAADQSKGDTFITFGRGEDEFRVASLLRDVKAGSRVLVSPYTGQPVSVVAPPKPKPKREETFHRVEWDSIGGAESAKRELRMAIDAPMKHGDLIRSYGRREAKGVLLYGPPGCGKTLIAKAAATHVIDTFAKNRDGHESAFIYMRGPEVLDKYVGAAEEKIRDAFRLAREHKRANGYQAVLFIDEAEAILPRRGSMRSSDVDRTIVPTFLAEMDGLEKDGPFLILATNLPNSLDAAVVREGRIDAKIEIPRPDVKSAADIFRVHLRGIPMQRGVTREVAALHGTKAVFTSKAAARVSGSLIEGVVQRGVSFALQRDIKNRESSPTGLCLDDMSEAVAFIEAADAALIGAA